MKMQTLLGSKSKSERQLGHIMQSEEKRGKTAKASYGIAVATQRGKVSDRLGVRGK